MDIKKTADTNRFARRVVITGMGLVSSIGNSVEEVAESLYYNRSGIIYNPEYVKTGLLSHICGNVDANPKGTINNKKISRFMSNGAAYSYLAMQQAVARSGLTEKDITDPRTGLFIGTGAGSPATCVNGAKTLLEKGLRKMQPTLTAQCMASSPTASLDVLFGIKGPSFSIASACATSSHCIGEAFDKIALGRLDTAFAGGCEECDPFVASTFDRAMALSRRNDNPQTASRPYDKDRDGFVISGGGGVVILEERERALSRKATILGEMIGYGASSDGTDMMLPSGEGAARCMEQAFGCCPELKPADIDYINAHGTSTPLGDLVELEAIGHIFGSDIPPISSTKAITGHAIGAAGVHELIYSMIMMREGFLAPSANIETLDPGASAFPIIRERINNKPQIILSNSFGFGGTNATLIFKEHRQ